MSESKRGRLSHDEMTFIKNNIKELGAEQTAKHINRTVECVCEYAMKKGIAYDNYVPELTIVQNQISEEFKNTPEWEILKQEFIEAELQYFAHRYSKLMSQFKQDVLPTEETQIFQLIKFEILMNRNLKSSKRQLRDIHRLEKELTSLYTKYADTDMPDNEKSFAQSLENQLISERAGIQARSTEFIKLQEKHSSLMKELKGTRDQRIKNIENSKQDFLSLLKMLQEADFRETEGKQMELVKLAATKEVKKLGEYHTYADGTLDRPILSADTINEGD